MWEKLTRVFQGNESPKINEVDSYNLPGHEEIGGKIIEAAENGRYDAVISLNDDKFRTVAWYVEDHYLKYSSKYQNLDRILKEKGYSHRIIEFSKDDYYTGLHLYISWKCPDEKIKEGTYIIEAIEAKRISDSHTKNKINYSELEKINRKISRKITGVPVEYYPVEVPVNHLNQNEFNELIDQLENKEFSHDLAYSKTYDKYVLQVK